MTVKRHTIECSIYEQSDSITSNWLRPDHHIDVDKKHEDMSFQELMYGMNCVRDKIRRENLIELKVEDYDAHMSFVTMKGQTGAFPPKALALYDHKVVSRVIERKIPKFTAGDVESVNAHLSAEHMTVVETLLAQQKSGGSGQQQSRRRRQGQGGWGPRSNQGQENRMNQVCRKWNFTLCDYQDCRWAHICCHCSGGHKGKDCRFDRNQQQQQQQRPQQPNQQQPHA